MANLSAARARTSFLIAALVVAAGSGGRAAVSASPGGRPANQAGAVCRTYPTLSTSTVSRGVGVAETIATTCTRFNTVTNQMSCTTKQAGRGISVTIVIANTYASLADFVDEVKTVPPLSLSTTTSMAPSRGPSSLRTNSYDGQHRMIRSVTVTAGSTQTETHTAWDAAGRSTKVTTAPASGPASISSNAYNDVARTLTITTPGVAGSMTLTFDANGNLMKSVASWNGITTTTTNAITATDRICR